MCAHPDSMLKSEDEYESGDCCDVYGEYEWFLRYHSHQCMHLDSAKSVVSPQQLKYSQASPLRVIWRSAGSTNKRTDKYGGPIENRCRLGIEVRFACH